MKQRMSLGDVGIRLKDLECLEKFLIAVPHCERHKCESLMLDLEGKTKEAEKLEDSWKSCKKCDAIRREWWQGAWKVQSNLFRVALNPTKS